MVNHVFIDGSGHKVARSVKNREEYFALRNSVQNRQSLMLARNGDEKAKARLVQFNYNDLLPDGILKGCCHPASTFAGDIDCGSQKECAEIAQRFLDLKEEIGLVELSRSARYGLHYICLRKKGTTILENQVRIAMLTKTEMDTSTHDLQRVMFTVTADGRELLFLDDRIFDEPLTVEESAREYELLKEREKSGLENVPKGAKKTNKHYVPKQEGEIWKEEVLPTPDLQNCAKRTTSTVTLPTSTFKGISYADIIAEWWRRNGGEPSEGERNVKLHQLAVNLRAICDNRKDLLLAIMPTCGLGETELKSIIDSACKENPKGISKMMKAIVEELEDGKDFDGETEDDGDSDNTNTLPISVKRNLPVGLKESLIGVPKNMQMPVLCAVMPIAATYADLVDVRYCDGMEQKLGLMSIILGDQASGKSVCKNAVDIWKRQLDEEDALARKREEEWKERKKSRKSNEKAPEDPHVLIRVLPVTVSCSTLLKRFKNSCDHTLYSFGEELDTLRKTNGAGSWSSKYDIYRLSFDRGEWGQDYNSDQAESGVVRVAYNWTMLGTYGAMRKCFKSDNIENGLSSRILVAEMPDSSFAKMPKYGKRSLEDEAKIQEAVNALRKANGLIDTPRLRKSIEQWVEEKRVEAAKDIDRVKDTYRKRAAVIGFRCGVIFHLLTGKAKETQACIDFALMMADYCLAQQIKTFGETLKRQYIDSNNENNCCKLNASAYDQLPSVFSSDDLRAIKGESCKVNSLRMIISRWVRDGWIKKIRKNQWQKV
ncbi:MAG: hypothetical protein IJK87_13155 [Prevotella sp.]|nr:hypothetical protein [Prevotella sp.]